MGHKNSFKKDFEFHRLQRIELKSIDKQPLSMSSYKPYLPKRIANGHSDKIKEYIDKLSSARGQATSKLSMTSPIKITPKEVTHKNITV